MVKTIGLVRRGDGVSEAEFGASWLSALRAVAATAPGDAKPRGLLGCVVRPGRRQLDVDGVTVSWFDDDDHCDRWVRHAGRIGEESTVIRVTEKVATSPSFVGAARTNLDTPTPMLIALLQRLPSVSREFYADYWWNNHRVLADRDLPPEFPMLGYVHNYVALDDPAEWDGIGEIYEPSLDVVRQRMAWLSTDAGEALRIDETKFMRTDTRRVLVTEQHVVVPYTA